METKPPKFTNLEHAQEAVDILWKEIDTLQTVLTCMAGEWGRVLYSKDRDKLKLLHKQGKKTIRWCRLLNKGAGDKQWDVSLIGHPDRDWL